MPSSLSAPGERLRTLWQRLSGLPGGKTLFSAGWQAEPGWDAERDGLPMPAAELPWLGAALR